jgi:1-acyl-sn-glycerol-3-phosphate acyltransferase
VVEGRENIPKDQPVLFAGNHRSIFDVICAMPYMGTRLGIVAKKELGKVPLLSWWMKQMHTMFLDRDDLKAGVQMITDAQNLVKSGYSVLIYPEGTRNHKEGTLLPFHGGSFKIAIRTGCPIIPVTTVGTGDVFEDHFPKLKCRTVHVIFGEPIPTKGMPIPERKVLHEKVRDIIAENYAKYAPMDKEERHEQ